MFRKKQNLILIFFAVAAFSLCGLQAFLTGKLSANGNFLYSLEEENKEIAEENKTLAGQIEDLTSVNSLTMAAKDLGFQKAGAFIYLLPQPLAMRP